MGRPPCCDKIGIKKGPWTPEEDIILVSYIQENGPGNWRAVPTNTGLMRCSKSCRLRWTNYLRPGIKRGNFSPQEEGLIIQLQALMGNRWAAIASYLPQRTDNDIKNYWNTHLKKKIKKFQYIPCETTRSSDDIPGPPTSVTMTMPASTTEPAAPVFCQNSCSYASSTENISRLLQNWARPPSSKPSLKQVQQENKNSNHSANDGYSSKGYIQEVEQFVGLPPDDRDLDMLLGIPWDKSSSNSAQLPEFQHVDVNNKRSDHGVQPPFSFIEKWLLEETTAHVEDLMDLSLDCCPSAVF